MGLKGTIDTIYLETPRYAHRIGLDADLRTQPLTTAIFRITGGPILVITIFGRIVTANKQAAAQALLLTHSVGGGLCIASATTTGDVINSIYTITGVVGDAMIVAQLGPALGIGQSMSSALGSGTGNQLVLGVGDISMVTSVATDADGFINWTLCYLPLTPVSLARAL